MDAILAHHIYSAELQRDLLIRDSIEIVFRFSGHRVYLDQNALGAIMAQNDNVDITEKNIIGAIDRFATNIALAGLAMIPSCLIVIFMPWRLTPMIASDQPEGRAGVLLAPGVFFPLIVISSLVLIASIVPELTLSALDAAANSENVARESSGVQGATYIGQDDIRQMAAAWRAGQINQVLLVFLPVFTVCVVTCAATSWIRVIVGSWWTVRTAVRCGFYIFGALIGIASAMGILVTQLEMSAELGVIVSTITSIVMIVFVPWCYFAVLKSGGVAGKWRLFSAAILATITIFVASILAVQLFS